MVDLTLSLKDAHELAKEVIKETGVIKDIEHPKYMAYYAAEMSLRQTEPKLASYSTGKALYYLQELYSERRKDGIG